MTSASHGAEPGVPPTRRELILQAAVELFGRRGFRGTTVRAIAEQAGVDPALVMHHFGSKEKIFSVVIREAMRADAFLPEPGEGTDSAPGRKLLRAFLVRWEASAAKPSPLMVVFRSAMEHPEASRLFSEVASGEFLLPLATRLRAPDPHLQATVLGVLLVGLVTGRYVVRVEPLASLSLDAVVDLFGPHVDRMIGDWITPETETA
ncbi:TetR family transcriptional regulator [Streptomyces sp. NBC_01725]|uniref:TetR/AcrR family transcriptional regulator n=1 Tax=unclassified Streptomyces TaxID=2593676 RepID=UPI0011CAF8E4|nr:MULTISPECIES: TetR/AcrR family transcriptional regulator [unclassified Streptomyces]TXL85788.1 TetR/AcrR family transcriptional regulator [Streptomyces sp. IB2014 016-6]